MFTPRKIATTVGLVFIGLFEISERADFVKAHLPRWITMHSEITIIALLICICLSLLFTDDKAKGNVPTLPEISNSSAGGIATATAAGGKVEQHFHSYPDTPPSVQPPPRPKHNVQYVGFKSIQIDPQRPGLSFAILYFQNIPIAGESVGEFRHARVRVTYRHESTDEEITDIFPARWNGEDDAAVNIGFHAQGAVIASCIGDEWTADRTIKKQAHWGTYTEVESIPIPTGTLKITATLIGENNISLAPITGILTLGNDSTASFVRR
jgi:hypothetical protein